MVNSDDVFHFAFITFLIGLLIGGAIGTYAGKTNIYAEAVKAGAAHYESGNDGTAVFKWGAK